MSERLFQQDFIDLLAEKHGMNKKDADKFVKEFFLLIEEALEKDKYVKIKGFGTFKLVDVESRESINVNSGERFQIQGYTKVSFTPDNGLRDLVNKPFAHFETVVLNENTVLEDTPVSESEEENEESPEVEQLQNGAIDVGDYLDNGDVAIVEKEVVEEVFDEKENFSVEEEISPITDQVVKVIETIDNKDDKLIEESDEGVVTMIPQSTGCQTAEEIIARELAIASIEADNQVEINKEVFEEKLEVKPVKKERSPISYLVVIILVVVLLCGGALSLMYYPDLFESADQHKQVNDPVQSASAPVAVQDTVVKKDTVAESISPVKQIITPVPVTEVKKELEAVKKEEKTVNKPAPFNPDSVGYIITGTKTTYTIKEGETLTKVALRFYGTKNLWPYIVKHNPDIIKNPDNVPFGTTIKIPELVKK